MSKNIAESTFREVPIEEGFFIIKFQNNSDETTFFKRDINNSYIQLHYCVKGNCKFHFNNNDYTFNVLDKHAIFLYNPQQDLPINLEILPRTSLVSVLISIKKFHTFFSKEASYIPFLSENNKNKKYYDNTQINANVLLVLQQILTAKNQSSMRNLYIKGKTYELLSLHFDSGENTNEEYCPFLVDDREVLKIRKAKDIIIARMSEPPSLQDLANEVGLNLKKLKEGFKQIYGDTVYSFLFDYKMDHARKLLESNQYNVNEVGLQVGYSTSSHFIAAFKKKFGTTPKQYVMSLTQ
ncbi:AraC family transcriptional regulator [Tenacibaculum tangerinum]|uniref:AraC family transcriptional regulator n=1 Tax=Tenacibaculum tangerinum TaxID=3038772 RepID=A0ABY8L7R3_9FLAO|nr:AraC family transcriptional regulator [Tenacibaculum tangerinum]WGH76428.1 AraC family transcriptional regulator [Tenacibaculum tangerinum]